jgi:hypothetical protein
VRKGVSDESWCGCVQVVFNMMSKHEGLHTLEAAGGVMFITLVEAIYPGKALLGPSEY